MKDILIIKPSALGDVIQATCVLPVIKKKIPHAAISWVVFEANKEILANHPLIHQLYVLNRQEKKIRQIIPFLTRLRKKKFDAVIDLQGLIRSSLIGFAARSPRKIGFANAREKSYWFYNEKIPVATTKIHAVDSYLALLRAVGFSAKAQITFPLPLTSQIRERVKTLLKKEGVQEPIITICPTAKWRTKMWAGEKFASLADILIAGTGGTVVFVGAPHEKTKVAAVCAAAKRDVVNMCGKLSLLELAALMEQSNLYVGNDSGPMHLAAAVNTSIVAIFGPTDPKRCGPYSPNARVVRVHMDCMPCYSRSCKSVLCLDRITPRHVAEHCFALLRR